MLDTTDRKIVTALAIVTGKDIEELMANYEATHDTIEGIIVKQLSKAQ